MLIVNFKFGILRASNCLVLPAAAACYNFGIFPFAPGGLE
jgi:hypothetical protein